MLDARNMGLEKDKYLILKQQNLWVIVIEGIEKQYSVLFFIFMYMFFMPKDIRYTELIIFAGLWMNGSWALLRQKGKVCRPRVMCGAGSWRDYLRRFLLKAEALWKDTVILHIVVIWALLMVRVKSFLDPLPMKWSGFPNVLNEYSGFQLFKSPPWFLLVQGQAVHLVIAFKKILGRLAVDSDLLSYWHIMEDG